MLDGKVALITGGARGLGRAHAITCAREGADVIVVDIAEQMETVPYAMGTQFDLDETMRLVQECDGGRCLALQVDVRSQEQLDNAVRAGIADLGKIDILIANAGIWTQAPFWEITEQAWDEMIGVNLTGVWRSVKAVTPHMIERQAGSIVITSSVNGLDAGINFAHYVAAKHGVIGLMKSIALELAPYGIRCNSINPGAMNTPMIDNQGAWDMFAGHEGGTQADLFEGGYHFHALKGASVLPAQVIADTALYLNSDLAAAVTGVTIPVDAGHMLLPRVNQAPVRE